MTESPPRVPFHDLTGVEIIEAKDGQGVVRAPDRSELKNHFETMHGGMLYTVGEVAAAVGVTRMMAEDLKNVRAVTRKGSIEYLKPARGAITATSRVSLTRAEIMKQLETHPSISVPVDVRLTDDNGVLVATLQIEWFVGGKKQ